MASRAHPMTQWQHFQTQLCQNCFLSHLIQLHWRVPKSCLCLQLVNLLFNPNCIFVGIMTFFFGFFRFSSQLIYLLYIPEQKKKCLMVEWDLRASVVSVFHDNTCLLAAVYTSPAPYKLGRSPIGQFVCSAFDFIGYFEEVVSRLVKIDRLEQG